MAEGVIKPVEEGVEKYLAAADFLKGEEKQLQNLTREMFFLATTYFALFSQSSVLFLSFTIVIGSRFIIAIFTYYRKAERIENDWNWLLNQPHSNVPIRAVRRPKSNADLTLRRNSFVCLTFVCLSSVFIVFFCYVPQA